MGVTYPAGVMPSPVRTVALISAILLTAITMPATVPAAAAASVVPTAVSPTHSIKISGAGVASYPQFDPAIKRYGITTTGKTDGTVKVTAKTSDPKGRVYVDGKLLSGSSKTVKGLSEGDEIAVFIVDKAGTARHSFIYLPAKFPRLKSASLPTASGGLASGKIMLTLGLWVTPSPFFETAVDRNGVPVMVRKTANSIDLKPLGNGHYSVGRQTQATGRSGVDVVELDEQFRKVGVHRTVGLSDTDGHDSLLRPDGSRYLLAYESDGAGHVDSIVQQISASGDVMFEWNSADHVDIAAETVVAGTQYESDYAHINSIQVMADGDLLLSFRHLSSVFKVARTAHDGFAKGDVVWRFGGRLSDFSFTDLAGHDR